MWAAINGRGELILKRCPPKVKSADYQATLQSAIRFIKPRYAIRNRLCGLWLPHRLVPQAFRGPVSTRWRCGAHVAGNQELAAD